MFRILKRVVKHLIPRALCVYKLRPSAHRSVLLTFDDGPCPGTTVAVLDKLKSYGARALFFVVGHRAVVASDVLKRMLAEGHVIGNHTFTHPRERSMPFREYLDDLRRCQDAIAKDTGIYARFHRPPRGQISWGSMFAPRQLGLKTIMWSQAADDWSETFGEVAIQRSQLLANRTSSGDIVLLHDERPHILTVLDHVLPVLKEKGLNLSPDIDAVL